MKGNEMTMNNILALVLVLTVAAAAKLDAQRTTADSGAGSGAALTTSDTAQTPVLRERNARYQLRKGDSFDADFPLTPEFNQTLTIQPDGFVTLKAVGSVLVEGLTVPEVTDKLKAAYAPVLHEPQIAVILKDFEKPYFIASGQVAKPGKYDLRSDLTLTEAVAIAGGFNDKAKHSQVVLFRPRPDGMYQARQINVKKMLAARDLKEDILLEPGDLLYVPQSVFSRIRPYIPSTSIGAYMNAPVF
jgi:polysaccharide biosynthesis/export protein